MKSLFEGSMKQLLYLTLMVFFVTVCFGFTSPPAPSHDVGCILQNHFDKKTEKQVILAPTFKSYEVVKDVGKYQTNITDHSYVDAENFWHIIAMERPVIAIKGYVGKSYNYIGNAYRRDFARRIRPPNNIYSE